jgi:hypothetical protein
MRRRSDFMCLWALMACALLFGQEPSSIRPLSPEGSFQRLRSKADVERLGDLTTKSVSGHYSSTTDELRRRVSILDGDDLYLFPDGTYIYCAWTDIAPVTIRDKGRWVVSGNEIELTSDPDIKWYPRAERHYLLARRRSPRREVLAIGIDRDLTYFEQNAMDNPNFMLLLLSKTRIAGISSKDSAALREKLMREAWHPDFFTTEKVGRPKE